MSDKLSAHLSHCHSSARGVRKFIAGIMPPRDGNSSGALRGVSGRQSGHLTHCRSRNQAGS